MKIKKIIPFVTICTLIAINTSNAQNLIWSLPKHYFDHGNGGIINTFLTGTGVAPDYIGDPSTSAHNSMCDKYGNLLFFVVDNSIYDSDGYLIDVIQSPITTVAGDQEIAIVPDPTPGSCLRYYIFSSCNYEPPFFTREPFYAILDLTQDNIYHNNRKGALEINSDILSSCYGLNSFRMGELPTFPSSPGWVDKFAGYAISEERADLSRLVFIHDGADRIYRLILSPSGLTYDGFLAVDATYDLQAKAELELVSIGGGNYKIACSRISNFDNGIWVAELNSNGQLIPGKNKSYDFYTTTSPHARVHGLEFSANGNYLYVTHEINGTYPNAIQYFDVSNLLLPLGVPASLTGALPTEMDDFSLSYIERSVNDQMHFINDNRMATFSNPNIPSSGIWDNNAYTGLTYNISPSFIPPHGYTLPDQIDGMNYTDYLLNVTTECCLISSPHEFNDFDIDGNPIYVASSGTWDNNNNPLTFAGSPDAFIKHKLVIPPGCTLTINNMNLHFGPITNLDPGGMLEIQRGNGPGIPGGKLILNNCTLTVDDNCNPGAYMWRGVEVHGYQTELQTPYGTTQQGRIELNNSQVEHAMTGILASKRIVNSFDYGYDGGIIRGVNSTFENNQYDVIMLTYTMGSVNQAYFTNCNFITTSLLNVPTLFTPSHVYLNDLKNITFKGCDFRNDYATDATILNELGIGIMAGDAKVTVQDYCPTPLFCPTPDHSLFKNLNIGIRCGNASSIRPLTCTGANFINNRGGILMSYTNFAIVTKNNFEIYKAVAPNSTAQVYGLYMYACNGYRVQENIFQEFNHPTITATGNSYGTVVHFSGEFSNEIYKNKYLNLRIGGQSQGINAEDPGIPGILGLKWKCNDFYDNMAFGDLVVTSGRIAYDQGYFSTPLTPNATLTPAGNTFNHIAPSSIQEIWANTSPPVQNFSYSYHDSPTLPNPYEPYNYGAPLVDLDLVSNVYCPLMSVQCCPSKIGVKTLSQLITEVQLYKNQIEDLYQLIDGGSTSDLLAYVYSPFYSLGQKKDMLLSKSPYLSDEVILAYLSLNPPIGHIQTILLANSGVSDAVWEAVQNLGLPNGIHNSINNSRNILSERDKLMQSIGGLKSEKDYNLYEVVGYYLRDTISVSPMDSILQILDEEEEKLWLTVKGDANLEKGAIIEAINIKQQMVNLFGEDNTSKMLDLNIQLSSYPSRTFGILHNPTLLNKTIEIAEDNNDVAMQAPAESILSFALDSGMTDTIEEIMIPHSLPINMNNNAETNISIIKIYPNPAIDELFIEAISNSNGEAWKFVNVTITDMQGRVLLTKVNLNGWSFLNLTLPFIEPGNYLLKLSDEFGNFEVQSFIKVQ